jgi:chromosome segregation protein
MYLQSLELFGFKSFVAKTRLEFHRGVTAVVGPNGCGKSNILDAIRWVLGEQSAKALRGGEMADVIFSGTDARPAVGMAEVSMTFAECEEQLGLDWHEVTIARRVYRDGGSEYFLNKTPCRLRDIHQMFMDTGIGRSAYSIMEQGKIDMILSSRPEDRRAIFEEAAGITKYKAQKKEALRKLEATDANLLRLSDIIKEVKRQIGSLQRQAGKARRYQALLTDLKLLETHLAKRQFDQLEEQRTKAAEEVQRLADRQVQSEQEIERQELEISAERAEIEAMEQRLNQGRQIVNDFKSRIGNHENRLIFNSERADEFGALMERYRVDIAGAEEKLRVAQTQLRNTESEIEQITVILATELRAMEEKQAAAAGLIQERQKNERLIEALDGDLAKIESRVNGLRGEMGSVGHQRDGAEARLAILASELGQLETAVTRAGEQYAQSKTELERAVREEDRLTEQAAAAERHLHETQATLAALDLDLRATQRLLSDKESKRDVLRQLNEGGEGFSEGTQAILRGLDNPDFFLPAVLGAVAQFIEVAPEYVTPVEAALGTHLQTIVMKDVMIAESVIKTLAAHKLGKASLALRDLLGSRGEAPAVETLPEGTHGLLLDKVTVNGSARVDLLIKQLLAAYVLVPDMETALRLSENSPQHNWVTPAGEVLTREGILHGGATGEAQNSVLQRKNQIVALEAEAHEIRGSLQNITSRRDAAVMAIEMAQANVDEAREEKQSGLIAVSTLRGQLGMFERELHATERKQQNLEGERASSEARRQEAAARLEALEAELRKAVQRLESLQTRRDETQQLLEGVRAREVKAAEELNELRIKVATERQRHTSLHQQRQPMETRLAELNELITQRRRDIDGHEQRVAAMAAENGEIEENLERLRSGLEHAEGEVTALVDERVGKSAAVEELNNTLRILRHQLTETHNQRSRIEVKQTQLEMRATSLAEHIQKRYQVALHEFRRDLHALRVAVREQTKRQQLRAGSLEENAASGGSESEIDAEEKRANRAERVEKMPEDADRTDSSAITGSGEAFDLDWNRIETLVRELDQRIDSMGPVNLDAIQEYDELEERHAFLEKQNTDLANARTELIGVIAKINHTTRQLFAETFEKIRINFSEMFVELFGGGKANLLLLDESDPLESGIEIIARPPGKQLQSISLLSGGERTMTAVALLFSIYMVKPSPFCVLDEMDAPLDESNINRFIKILDRFVAQSQFVVISHNKRTIARADAIYGVTMEEQGISKLVGVTFTRREESHAGRDIIGTNNPAPMPSVAEAFGKHGDLHSERLQAG